MWRVWSTVPLPYAVALSYREGWLTFESPEARRRLSPIPSDWESVGADRLCEYCGRAQAVGQTPTTGARPIEPRPD